MHNAPSDPFLLLALPRRFDLDPAAVESAYLARIATIHPDLSDPTKDPSTDPTDTSARLNDAKAVLLDPERRAIALLALLGGPTAREDPSLPDGFLLDIMETRQAVEADRGDPAAIARWEAWARTQRAAHAERIRDHFALAEHPSQKSKALALVRRELNAWRYIERLLEQLDPEYTPARADF